MDDLSRRVIGGALTVKVLNEAHRDQCVDDLKAFGPRPGSLLNFGMKRLEIEHLANTG